MDPCKKRFSIVLIFVGKKYIVLDQRFLPQKAKDFLRCKKKYKFILLLHKKQNFLIKGFWRRKQKDFPSSSSRLSKLPVCSFRPWEASRGTFRGTQRSESKWDLSRIKECDHILYAHIFASHSMVDPKSLSIITWHLSYRFLQILCCVLCILLILQN